MVLFNLLKDKSGQDIIEYMLLAAFVGITGYAGMSYLGETMLDYYPKENQAIQDLWETPSPIKE